MLGVNWLVSVEFKLFLFKLFLRLFDKMDACWMEFLLLFEYFY
jgi:hypothetical protein